jgi:hypothetical protein
MATITGALNNQYLEVLAGTPGDDDFYPRGGWDMVDGGGGYNVVHVQGNSTDYKLSVVNGVTYVDSVSSASASIQDTELLNIQLIKFDDKSIDLTAPIHFQHQSGGQHFYGGPGIDSVTYPLPKASYEVSKSGNIFVVTDNVGNSGVDILTSIERLNFKDVNVALDLAGNAGDVVKILGAVFGAKTITTHPDYVGLGLSYRDSGMSYSSLMSMALKIAGLTSPELLVSQLWTNVMHQAPSQADMQPFLQMLASGTSAENLALLAANSAQNLANINLVGLTASGVIYT